MGPTGVVDRVLGSAFVLLAAIMLTIRPFPQMHTGVLQYLLDAVRLSPSEGSGGPMLLGEGSSDMLWCLRGCLPCIGFM